MRYIPELDGLRAVAVVAVVLFHADPSGPFSGGFVGVDLFFVLSGFLITSILAAEWKAAGSIDLWRFYRRRFLRLMPALLFLLAVYLVVAPLAWPGHPHGRDALLTGLYLSDYSYAFWQAPFYLQHTWSLAVEEQFYLLWPLLLVPLLKTKRPLLWLGIAWLAVTVWRASFTDWTDYYYRFDTRGSGLLLGAMLAFVRFRAGPMLGYASLGLLGLIFLIGNIAAAMLFISPTELAAAALILAPLPFLANPALVWTGKISYGIYLWHFPIAYALRSELPFAFTAPLTLALSIGCAALSFYTVEAWARRLKIGYGATPALSARY